MQLIIELGGAVRCIYSEEIDLTALGSPVISRASHVEPDQQGRWRADLAPVAGPILGPFLGRSEALAAEHAWLEANWLGRAAGPESVFGSTQPARTYYLSNSSISTESIPHEDIANQ